jgi:hypothetical protein
MARYSSFYRRTSQALLLSFAFFLVSDIAWIGYCEVTAGSLSVFFCDHENVDNISPEPHKPLSNEVERHLDVDHTHEAHSESMTSAEPHKAASNPTMDMGHTHLEGLSCKTICYLKASQPNGGEDATNPLKRGLAHTQDLLTVLAEQTSPFQGWLASAMTLDGHRDLATLPLDVDPHPPKLL